MRVCFIDIETTGLNSEVDQITEIAWIAEDYAGQWVERSYVIRHDRLPSDWVLQNTDYLTRIAPAITKEPLVQVLGWLGQDVRSYGSTRPEVAHLVGACIAFDDRFLRRAYGVEPPYHYHVVDVEAMAYGALGLGKMPSLKDLRSVLGIPGENEAAHTALADAREVKLIYDALLTRNPTVRAEGATQDE